MKLNKKNKISLLMILLSSVFYLQSSTATAASPTPFPSQNQISTDSADLEKIQKIKDIVASRVAELNLVEKRGIIGKVKDVAEMEITIIDIKGKTRHIDVDELTNFSFSSKSSVGISDIEKGETYSFVGLYNKETERLLARDIDSVDSVPVYFEGAISSVDDDNYQLTAVNDKGEKKIIDIQSSTKTTLATSNGDLEKSGFSKLSTNERVLAVGFWDKKDKNLLSTLRIIHFQDAPPSKEMQTYISAASSSAKQK
jgi:hypothetical protein